MRAAKPVRPAAAVRDSSAASSSRRLPGGGSSRLPLDLRPRRAATRTRRDRGLRGRVVRSQRTRRPREDERVPLRAYRARPFSEAANEAEDAPADLLRRGLLKVGEAGASALADATVDELASVAAAEATDDATSSRREAWRAREPPRAPFSCRAFNSRGLLVRGRLPSPATAANEPVARLMCSLPGSRDAEYRHRREHHGTRARRLLVGGGDASARLVDYVQGAFCPRRKT